MNLNKMPIGQKFNLKIGSNLTAVSFQGSVFRGGVIKYKFAPDLVPNFTFYFTQSEFDRQVVKRVS